MDSLERLVLLVTGARKVLPVLRVSLDLLDPRVKLVSPVNRVSREPLAPRVFRVREERQAELDHREQLERLV